MNSSSDHVNSSPIFVSVSPPDLHHSFPQGTWVARTCCYSSVCRRWAIASAKPVMPHSLCSSFLRWLAGWVLVCLGLASQILLQQTCTAIKADMKLIVCFFWLHPLSYKICTFFSQAQILTVQGFPPTPRIFCAPILQNIPCQEGQGMYWRGILIYLFCLAEFFL